MGAIVWDNGGGDGLYSTVTNWVGDALPGSGDIATFNSTSVANCAIDVDPACQGIHILTGYTGTVTQNAGIAINTTPPSGTVGFKQQAGTFTGGDSVHLIDGPDVAGNVFELSGGAFTQTSGNFTVREGDYVKSGGTYSTPAGGVLTISGNFAAQKFDPGGNSANEQYDKIVLGTLKVTLQSNLKCDGDFTWAMNANGQFFDVNDFNLECRDFTGTVGSTSSSGKMILGTGTITVNRDFLTGTTSTPNGLVGETSTIVLKGTGGGTRVFSCGFFHAPAGNTQFNNVTIEGPYDSTAGRTHAALIGGLLKITATGSYDIKNAFAACTTKIIDGGDFLLETGGVLNQTVATAGKNIDFEDSVIDTFTLEASTTFDPFELVFTQKTQSAARTIPASITYRRVIVKLLSDTAADAIFNLGAGTFTMTEDLVIVSTNTTNDLILNGDTNNPTMNIGRDLEFLANAASDVTLDFGSGTWTIDRNLETNGTGAGAEILNAQTSTIDVGGGGAAHNVDLDGGSFDGGTGTFQKTGAGAVTFNGTITYFDFKFGSGSTHKFTAGTTTTFSNSVSSLGSNASPSVLESTTPGTEYIFNNSGIDTFTDEMDVTDSDASPGGFMVAIDSIDGGNNTNWFFTSLPATGGTKLVIHIL